MYIHLPVWLPHLQLRKIWVNRSFPNQTPKWEKKIWVKLVVSRPNSKLMVSHKIADHPDVVGASPVCVAPSTSSFSTWSGFKGFGKESRNAIRESFKCWDVVRLILEIWRYCQLRGDYSVAASGCWYSNRSTLPSEFVMAAITTWLIRKERKRCIGLSLATCIYTSLETCDMS